MPEGYFDRSSGWGFGGSGLSWGLGRSGLSRGRGRGGSTAAGGERERGDHQDADEGQQRLFHFSFSL
jgi:hypothetical protein